MQYTVVHSKDPYLLARLATDLQMEGKKFYEVKPGLQDAFSRKFLVTYTDNFFSFYDVPLGSRLSKPLTSRNYIKVLIQILEP